MYEIGANEEEQKIQRELDRINRMTPIELKIAYLKKEGLLDDETMEELKQEEQYEKISKMSDEDLRAAFEAQENQDLSRGRVRKESNRVWFS